MTMLLFREARLIGGRARSDLQGGLQEERYCATRS
jgi:hypothetical protein